MTIFSRLLISQLWRVVLAIGLGAAVVASNMGLLAAAAYLVAAAGVSHLMALLIVPMYAVRVLSAVRGSGRYAERMVSHRVTFDILARLRIWLYDRIARIGPSGISGRHSGDTLGLVLADVDLLQRAYLLFVTPIAVALAVTLLLVAILFAFSSTVALVTLAYMLLCGAVLPALVLVAARKPGNLEVETRAHLFSHLVDSVQGHSDLVTNDAGTRYLHRTSRLGATLARAQTRLSAVAAGREAVTDLLANLAMLSALAFAIPLVTHHHIAGPYLAVPGLLALAGFEAIRPMGVAAGAASGVAAAARRVMEVGDTRLLMQATLNPVPVCRPYSLSFDNVTMHYQESHGPALRNITFTVPEGARIAIVGQSGAGKTTIARLMTRAWEPTEGQVLLGSHSVREYALRDLRDTVGVVAQDTYIFSASVRSNLRLGRQDASDLDMEAALEMVGLRDLVDRLPDGLDTWVGEHGRHLSGGERQRLAVARVLLQRTPILLLDEVTANLDPLAERGLVETLLRVTMGRTTIMITHRLLGLERMDEILVLEGGRIVEHGTHAQLCRAGGLYRRLLDTQNNMLSI